MRSLKGGNKNDKIRVAVRVRPPLEQEIRAGNSFKNLKVDNDNKVVNAYNERTNAYKNAAFDILFDHEASQGQIFADCGVHNLVKQVVDGYNSTIFAYGQTGSGKTFSMEGYKYGANDKGQPVAVVEAGEQEGIVPRSIRLLFEMVKQESGTGRKKFTVYCSYLQVYKERVYDLLNKSHLKRLVTDGPGLKLKWNKDHFQVENLYTFECRSAEDILALYHFGIKNKVVASHNMNNASSRSHSMLKITLECIDGKQPDNTIVSAMQLVDLAGSERTSQTGNVATKESIDINKSLLTLRQVITALTERPQGEQGYVPYRDSKLTCLLRQSLGGNSYTLMLACLNPCDAQIEENLSTLSYASKASFISNKPIKNEDPKTQQISELKRQVRLLTEELANANETISFLSQLTGQDPNMINRNLGRTGSSSGGATRAGASNSLGGNRRTPTRADGQSNGMLQRQDSAVTQKANKALTSSMQDGIGGEARAHGGVPDQESIERMNSNRVGTAGTVVTQSGVSNNAANETKDAITGRIIHTVNMMKEVLQGNLGLRETIQKQSELIDNQNAEIFQLQNENEDLRERLMILEDFTGKDSLAQVQLLVREKKTLEKRVAQLEQTSSNWANSQQKQRSTMTNFAKRSMIERDMASSIPSATESSQRREGTAGGTFDDDYEPARPSMRGGSDGKEAYDQVYDDPANADGYDNEPHSGSRQSSSIGMINRQARMLAQQNQRMSQGQSRKSNQRSIYIDAPSGIPVPSRGTTTERQTRSGSKGGMGLHPSNPNQYYMANNQSSTQGNIIPVARKRGQNGNYPPTSKQMNYMGSMSGQLREGDFTKSPAMNTGGKMSNSSLQGGLNRASMPRHEPMNSSGARTTTNWMQKQPPLSPSRNARDVQSRIRTELQDGLNSSQHSSYAQGHMRQVHSPDSLKMVDSAGDFIHGTRGASQQKRNLQASEIRAQAYKQYQQSRMPMADNDEPDIPHFQVNQNQRGPQARTSNTTQIDQKQRSQLPNI